MDLNRFKGPFACLMAALIWGTAFSFQRMSNETSTPLFFSACRFSLSAVALWLLSLALEGRNKRLGKAMGTEKSTNSTKYGLICGLTLAVACNSQQLGLVKASAAHAAFITALYVVLIPIIGFIFLRKKVSLTVWLAVIMAFAGTVYMSSPGEKGGVFTLYDLWLFIGAIFFAIEILYVDGHIEYCDPVRFSAAQMTSCSLISWIFAFIAENPNLEMARASIIPILYCGLMSAGVAYTLQIVGQSMTAPAVSAVIFSLETVFAAIGGAVILGEMLSQREIIGSIIIFAAVTIVQLQPSKE